MANIDQKRFDYIDVAKGITIILMVIGHTRMPDSLIRWIYSFHMPFFFIISGVLTNFNVPAKDFVSKKTKSLMIPFVVFSLINLAVFPIYNRVDPWMGFAKDIFQNGWGWTALWFIVPFWLSLVINRLFISHRLAVLAVSVATGIILSWCDIRLPWAISSIPVAVAYVNIGILIKSFHYRALEARKSIRWCMIIAGLSITAVISSFWRLDLASNRILPFIPLVAGAVAGYFMIVLISDMIAGLPDTGFFRAAKKCLISTGRYTFEIMALSQCLILVLNVYVPDFTVSRYLLLICMIMLIVQIKHLIQYAIKKYNIPLLNKIV